MSGRMESVVDYNEKRTLRLEDDEVQQGNREWWTQNTMSYDWKDKVEGERFTPVWFNEIDRRFLDGARLFSQEKNPFKQLMGGELSGKRVLEIGCGMGFHSAMIARAGADLSAIDLSPTSIAATTARLQLEGLIKHSDVRLMDAETLEFDSETFDLVWSWGVIHHSAHTGRIIKEIERVLKPGGQARLMVYNLEGAHAYTTIIRKYIFGFWKGRSLDELLWSDTDGFTARYYTVDGWRDLQKIFFGEVDVSILGLESDAVPLPRLLRKPLLRLFSERTLREWVQQRGNFLFSVSTK